MLADIIDKTVLVLTIAIIARALMTWIPNLDPLNPIVQFVIAITEPILKPIRSVMPRGMMIDFTPMIAIVLLQVIKGVMIRNLA